MRFGNTVIEPYHHEPEADCVHPAQMSEWSQERLDYQAGKSVGVAMKRILDVATKNAFPALEYDALKERLEDGYLNTTDIHVHTDRYDNWTLGVKEGLEDGK